MRFGPLPFEWPLQSGTEDTGTGTPAPVPPSSAGEQEAAAPPPAGEAPAGEDPSPSSPAAGATPPPQTARPTDWRDRRIAQLSARLREAQAATPPPAAAAQPLAAGIPTNQQELDRLVNERAAILATQADFNRRCDDTAKVGLKAYGSPFEQRVTTLAQLIDPGDRQSIEKYNSLLDAAIETGEGARLIWELGGDMEEASRIFSLRPAQMAVALAKRAAAEAEAPSAVPKPITPVTSRGASRELINPADPDRADGLSIDEWMRRREEQTSVRARR